MPEEIVLLGAHLDSWDLGTGAIDDGAGIGIVVAAAKQFGRLGAVLRFEETQMAECAGRVAEPEAAPGGLRSRGAAVRKIPSLQHELVPLCVEIETG